MLSIHLFDTELGVSLHLESIVIFKAEMSHIVRASCSASLLEQRNLSLKVKEMLVPLGKYNTTPAQPLW